MPSVSRRQHRFWEAIAHDPDFREKEDVSQNVANEYLDADERDHRWKKRERAAKKCAAGIVVAIMDELKSQR